MRSIVIGMQTSNAGPNSGRFDLRRRPLSIATVCAGGKTQRPIARRLEVAFAKTSSFVVRLRRATVVIALLAGGCGLAYGQLASPLPGLGPQGVVPQTALATLPKSSAELSNALVCVENRLAKLRSGNLAPPSQTEAAERAAGATADELREREQLWQQRLVALDQHGRHLQALKDARALAQKETGAPEITHGPAEAPSIALTEQLTDVLSARRVDLRTAELFLSIIEAEIARYSLLLNKSRKLLRLAEDEPATDNGPRRLWVLRLARLRVECHEASVETAQIGRLVTWEILDGQRHEIRILEEKLRATRGRTRISKSDLDAVRSQIQQKRLTLHAEIDDAIALDAKLRHDRDHALAQQSAGVRHTGVGWSAAEELANARLETNRRKIETARGLLRLADLAQTVWEDRFWATSPHTLRELRVRHRHHDDVLEELNRWKALMEQSLSAVSEQLLRETLKAESAGLSNAERERARQNQATLQERAWLELRAVGAIAYTQDLTTRLHTELAERVAGISVLGQFRSVWENLQALVRRIWASELYIAEDSVIAGGQKISIPRSITVGKVTIALTIFLLGLVTARGVFRLAGRIARRWTTPHGPPHAVTAKCAAAFVVLASLLIAMASVRIPWTIFAFLGGALAIGVGFGAQTLINNFISGIILLGERSIRVGDIVEVDDQRGKIVSVGFRNSLMSRGDGVEVLVPNSQFLEKKVVNWTFSNDLVRSSITVGVSYSASPEQVTRLVAQAAAEHSHVARDPEPTVLFDDFGESAMTFTLQFWMRLCAPIDGGTVRSDLRHRINTLFRENSIEMAFAQRDIHLDSTRPIEIKMVNTPRRSSPDAVCVRSPFVGQQRDPVRY